MKERNYDVVKTVVGILLAAIGFVLLRRYADSQGVMAVLPFVALAWAAAPLATAWEGC